MEQKSSTIVYILSMLGGILSTCFLITSLSLLGIFESQSSNIIVSILMIASAILLSRCILGAFFDTVSITLFIAGCVIPFLAYWDFHSLYIISTSIITFLFARNFILSTLASLMFTIGLYELFLQLFLSGDTLWIVTILLLLSFLLINLYSEELQRKISKKFLNYKALHTGWFLSCVSLLALMSVDHSDDSPLSPALCIFLLIVVHQIMKATDIKKRSVQCSIYATSLTILGLTFYAPCLSGSLFLILLCFHYQYLKEFAVSIILLIYVVSKFYYDLNFTLLTKSILLFSTGLVLLIAWYFLTQKKKSHEEI